MRKYHRAIQMTFILNLHIFSSHSQTIDPYPLANSVLPSYDAPFNESMSNNLRVSQNSWVIDLASWSNDTVLSNDNIRSQQSTFIYLSSGMNHHISMYPGSLCQVFTPFFQLSLQVQTLSCNVILRLSYIHPITRQTKLVDLFFSTHHREDFSFNGSWFGLDSINDGSIEQVESCIDLVTNETSWFFNELLNLPILISNHNSILTWIFNSCDYYSSFFAMSFMEDEELV